VTPAHPDEVSLFAAATTVFTGRTISDGAFKKMWEGVARDDAEIDAKLQVIV
jgi:hypothetical protein